MYGVVHAVPGVMHTVGRGAAGLRQTLDHQRVGAQDRAGAAALEPPLQPPGEQHQRVVEQDVEGAGDQVRRDRVGRCV